MKHSDQIKFPNRYLLVVAGISLVTLLSTSGFVYLKWQASKKVDSSKHQSIVNQLNKEQFDKAYQVLKS